MVIPDHADPAGRLIVSRVSLRDFRSYARLDLALRPGIVLVVGPNGAGKTNLLESLHVGTQGFSPRTRVESQLVRFGTEGCRIALHGRRASGVPVDVEVVLRRGEGRRSRLNGAPLQAVEELRRELATLVFTPDRLAVVKGGPLVRRAYFDRTLARLFPARAELSPGYGAALTQRNAALRRVSLGLSTREALAPWTERVVDLGRELVLARRDAVELLSPVFGERASQLGLAAARLAYDGSPPTEEALAARLERDLERGTTGLGPHLDDVSVTAGTRELRLFGSQGEQRLAVLSLLLAEAGLIAERTGEPPLLLLDDVLSELDPDRRRSLAERLRGTGQTLITATSASALPVEADQVLDVTPGLVQERA
ncbi:MAG: DNA replication and repair protein RecF [Actinobacteria bacterium]|nr:DNA replication and repair protein RecF [Actinomycetota bacterium]